MRVKAQIVSAAALAAIGTFVLNTEARGALIEQLQAANYNPGTGVWTATVGLNAKENPAVTQNDKGPLAGVNTVAPTLIAGQTPNGSSVVRFSGGNDLIFVNGGGTATGLPSGTDYTAFVFMKPSSGQTSDASFFGGQNGSFQYRLAGSAHQDVVRRGQVDLGAGTATITSSSFSTIDTTTSAASGTAYRLNGSSDGTGANSGGYTATIDRVGNVSNGANPSEPFVGDIAEIDIYNSVLDAATIASVENQLANSYVNPIPEPASFALLAVGAAGLMVRRRRA